MSNATGRGKAGAARATGKTRRAKPTGAAIDSYSPTARGMIERIARERGVTADEVLATFERLYAGKGPRKGARPIFAVEADAPAVTFADGPDAVTVTVRGAVLRNLKKTADAMNAVGWCDADNTPATVLDFWAGALIRRLADNPGEGADGDVSELATDIADGIDTHRREGSSGDAERRAELRRAFKAAGLL